jgi:hypothetical protein
MPPAGVGRVMHGPRHSGRLGPRYRPASGVHLIGGPWHKPLSPCGGRRGDAADRAGAIASHPGGLTTRPSRSGSPKREPP